MNDLQDQAERIFERALRLDQSERAVYVDGACSGSPELRARVEQLLADDEEAGSFLNRPLLDLHKIGRIPLFDKTSDNRHPRQAMPDDLSYTQQFVLGELIAGRFLVVRFIARGGMGEVYEVEDRQLRGAHFALKTILSRFADDPIILERFKREVLNAREISHPNVCPIYEFLEWERDHGRLAFLTMKLLAGETLANRLAHQGKLSYVEATAIAHQLASGLAAAHSAGILHRDIKPANIMLNGAEGQVYACITDFGLARSFVQDTTALTIGGLAGTPGYIAPELLYGGEPSAASDIFALGIVFFQMLTGDMAKSPLFKTAGKGRVAASTAIPPQWKRLIERCVEPSPELRCKDISEIVRSVSEIQKSVSAPRSLSRRKMLAWSGAACVAASGGAWLQRDDLLNLFVPLPKKRSVALMEWPAGESDALVSTILDSIGQRLVRIEAYFKDLVVFSTNDVLNSQTPIAKPQDAASALGVTLVLAASMHSRADAIHLELQLLNVVTGESLRHTILLCAPREITAIPERACRAALKMLGLPNHEANIQDNDELRRVSPEVLQIFSEAQQSAAKPNDSGLGAAILLFQKAVDVDPQFALGYAELAITYVRRFNVDGDRANLTLANGNSTIALRYNPNSARALLSAALVDLYTGNTKRAMEYFARALAIDPDNPQVLLYKAQAFRFMNQNGKAEEVYNLIISKRPNYWPAYNELGYLLSQSGRHEDAANAFRSAMAAAPPVALPQANLGSEYVFLNRRQDAIEACNQSIEKSPNDTAYRTLGDIAFMDGNYRSAESFYQKAAKLNPINHDLWRDIGDCEAMFGNDVGVRENYAKAARALLDGIPKHSGSAYEWATLAFYYAKTGDRKQAESALQKAGPYDSMNVATRLMMIQAIALLGRKEEALRQVISALDDGLSPIQVDLALDLKDLRKDPRYQSHVAKLKQADSQPAS
jgi:serine/threonine protein kinase/Flp pilus assembly protein TadD